MGYSVTGAVNVLGSEKYATLIQLIIILIKTVTSHLCSMSLHLFFVIPEFCKDISVCQEVGWLDHCAREEQFSRLNCFHYSRVAYFWVHIQCPGSMSCFQKKKARGGGEPVCSIHRITEVGSGRRASRKSGGQNKGFVSPAECGIDSGQTENYDGTYWLHDEI